MKPLAPADDHEMTSPEVSVIVRYRGNESLTVKDEDGWTPAHSAARGGHVNVLQCIVDVLGHVSFEAIASTGKPTIHEISSKYGQKAVSKFVKEQSEMTDEATIVPAPNVV